jgi:hypothetical protein
MMMKNTGEALARLRAAVRAFREPGAPIPTQPPIFLPVQRPKPPPPSAPRVRSFFRSVW